MVFYNLLLQFHLKNGQKKKKKKMIPFWAKQQKETEEKQNSATIIISVNGKGTVFPGKL